MCTNYKHNPDEISKLIGDGMKRVLKVEEILSDSYEPADET
ncbi:MAG: hypothetical protein R2942_12595 [Ignavibacteria bacterium]